MIATFYSHYGAMLTKKTLGNCVVLKPVPRALSSSCGTCAVITDCSIEKIVETAGDLLEAVYEADNGSYRKIYGKDS